MYVTTTGDGDGNMLPVFRHPGAQWKDLSLSVSTGACRRQLLLTRMVDRRGSTTPASNFGRSAFGYIEVVFASKCYCAAFLGVYKICSLLHSSTLKKLANIGDDLAIFVKFQRKFNMGNSSGITKIAKFTQQDDFV